MVAGKSAMLDDIKTIEYYLKQWGIWAYEARGLSVNYPSINAIERLRAKHPGGCSITDDEALQIDAAIAILCKTRPAEGDALAQYYLSKDSYRALARKMKKHPKAVSDLVNGGRMFIEGYLVE